MLGGVSYVLGSFLALILPPYEAAPVRHFEELPTALKVGQSVTVTTDGGAVRGTVEHLSPEAIRLRVHGQQREVSAAQVSRVARRVRNPGLGALVGFGAGLALGFVAAGSVGPSGSLAAVEPAVAAVIAGPLVGVAIGACAGALIKREVVVYRAPAIPDIAPSQPGRAPGTEPPAPLQRR